MWWAPAEESECNKCNTPYTDEIEFVTFCKSCNQARKLTDAQIIRAVKENKPFTIDKYSLWIDRELLTQIDVSPLYDAVGPEVGYFGCRKDHTQTECEAMARMIKRNLPKLNEIEIHGSFDDQNGIIAEAFKVNDQIRTIRFEKTPRNLGLVAKSLEHCEHVTEVILVGTDCTDDGARELFKSIGKNKSVKEISFRLESSLNVDAFIGIKEMLEVNMTLEILDFLDCQYSGVHWKILADGLKNAKGLKQLRLRQTNIQSDVMQEIFDSLSKNTTLDSIELSPLDRQGCIYLNEFLKADSPLQYLSVSDMTPEHINLLAEGIKMNTHLTSFGADCQRLTGDINAFLEAFKFNKTIVSLGLNQTKLNDKAVRCLAEVLKVNKTLKILRLTNCETKDVETWSIFVDALKYNTTMEDIGFGPELIYGGEEPNQSIVDLTADLIRHNTTLKILQISGFVQINSLGLIKDALMENDTLLWFAFSDSRSIEDDPAKAMIEELFSKNYSLIRLEFVRNEEYSRRFCERNRQNRKTNYEETVVLIHNFARSSHARNLLPAEIWCHVFKMLRYPGLRNFGSVAERIFKEQSNSRTLNEKKKT